MAETYKTIYNRGWSAGYKAAEEVAAEKLQEVIDYLKGPIPPPEHIREEPTEPVFTFACGHCTSWDEANNCCRCKTCWRIAEYGQQPVVHSILNPASPLRKAILTTHKNSKNRR